MMSADFEATLVSEGDSIIILQLPGQKSQTVMAPTETSDSVSFNVRKVGDFPPFWVPPP
jgi:hypothetical protein